MARLCQGRALASAWASRMTTVTVWSHVLKIARVSYTLKVPERILVGISAYIVMWSYRSTD